MCGMLGSISHQLMRDCLAGLGFSSTCSSIWEWNILNTKEKCLLVCLASWISGEPNNKPDGSLNDCLQCDEDKSGPNFKYFSGRTRRNSGIPSSIARPPDQIYNMEVSRAPPVTLTTISFSTATGTASSEVVSNNPTKQCGCLINSSNAAKI